MWERDLTLEKDTEANFCTLLLYDLFLGVQLKDQQSSLGYFHVIHAKICLLFEILEASSRSLRAESFLSYMSVKVMVPPAAPPYPQSPILLPPDLLDSKVLLHHLGA